MEKMMVDDRDEIDDEDYIDSLNCMVSDDESELEDERDENSDTEGSDDEMEEDLTNYPWNWQQREFEVPDKPFKQPFGHNTKFTLQNSALDIFGLFFSTTLLSFIVLATNLHAQRIIGSFEIGSSVKTRLEHNWYPVTVEELMAFMGIYLLSGLVQMKSWKDYFVHDDYGFTHSPVMFRTFSENRWKLIKRFLYFETGPGNKDNKLAKVWTVYTTLRTLFKQNWIPFQKVTCDEGNSFVQTL